MNFSCFIVNSRLFLFIIILSIIATPAISMSKARKKVLVTGGNKGIGKAICQALLEKYPDVHVILGSRDLSRGEAASKDICAAVPGSESRLDVMEIDVSSDASVESAESSMEGQLYGIVNNAGIGFGNTFKETVNTNYFGMRRVNKAFSKYLQRPGGRIVNIASASGPMFVNGLQSGDLKDKLSYPKSNFDDEKEIDTIAESFFDQLDYGNDAYGLSKALVNAYTAIHAEKETDFIINSCTPGFIDTDITRGMGASNPPSKGAVCPVHLLMSDKIGQQPTGWFYGSDAVRSPLHCYRDPGSPAYDGP
mmetsp:Transcript_17246/g.22413  ORF Transcript_17246/g.22413 Transcript_17246/m.22413 type:complete len:307 (-) Transcript_17246:173-1093(-)